MESQAKTANSLTYTTSPQATSSQALDEVSDKISDIEAQMYADAVRNMQVGIHIWHLEESKDDRDGGKLRLISTNAAASQFTSVPAEGLIGQTIGEIFPAVAATDIPSIYKEVARSGKGRDLGEVVYGDDRVPKGVFLVRAFPLRGKCVGIAFENITARKQAENTHLENEEQLRIIFEQASVGMGRLSPAGNWIQINQYLSNLLGYTAAELLEKSFAELTHPEDLALHQEHYDQLLKGTASQVTFEQRCITCSNDIVWVNTTLSAVHGRPAGNVRQSANTDSGGTLMYFIATIQNITERKEAATALKNQKNDLVAVNLMLTDAMAQLKQRNEELDQFAYVTSHDLKAPLRAIVNLANWIEEDIGNTLPEENREQFDLLKSRALRMEGLINGLLEYSRVDRTHQSHERIDIADLLSNIVDSISPPDTFTVELAPNLPILEAKKTPLVQVFSNLITNAIKHHNRSDGNVQISVEDVGDFYKFTVSDDGPGIDPAYHDKIFVIFQTLKSRDELESTGIGLSLVKKIIHAENGTISLDSKPGQGSSFRFTWPKSPHLELP